MAQLVEYNLAKVGVAGSSPVSRFYGFCIYWNRDKAKQGGPGSNSDGFTDWRNAHPAVFCEVKQMNGENQFCAYGSFAAVYDMFMDNIPYEQWAEYLCGILQENGVSDGLLLDLGCGTGSMTQLLAKKGYDMIGVDAAPEMLQIAVEKKEAGGQDILYLLQDMREFELYGTVRGVISVCDSLNYITDPEDLLQVFRLVNNYLDPGGVFVFDLNTVYKYENLGDCVIAENRKEASFIWENEYDPKKRLNFYQLSVFLREENGLYSKHEELHCQRAYTVEEIVQLLGEAGIQFQAAYDAFTHCPPKEESERIYIIARESGKPNSQGFRKT